MTRRVAVLFGTRPEAIKLAPVIAALRRIPEIDLQVVSTGQHREMLGQVLSQFEIVPDLELELMRPDQSLPGLTGRVLTAMTTLLAEERPDLVVVQGDTTSTFVSSLAAFYREIPVAHVEAGLRSDDVGNPFPEEVNRRLTSVLSRLHFAPTGRACSRLLAEGAPAERVVVTGNTVVDALTVLAAAPFDPAGTPLADLPPMERVLLVTSHRRESWGSELESICWALTDLVERFSDLSVVYPVHLNPNVGRTVHAMLGGRERFHLIPPLGYLDFIELMRRSTLILTDSGGVQEEAPSLGKPLLVLREVTERPEAFEAGMAKVVGTGRERIVQEASRLLSDPAAYEAMARGENPYGDGRAAGRIALALGRWARDEAPLLTADEQFRPRSATS